MVRMKLNEADKEDVLSDIADFLEEIQWDGSDKISLTTKPSFMNNYDLLVKIYIGDKLACRFLYHDILLDKDEDILSTKDVVEYLESREGWSLE